MNNQPPPISTDEVPTVDKVIADLETRKATGIQKYKVPLQPSNGRDSMQDAYEEALDLCVYLKNEILRREVEARVNMAVQKSRESRGCLCCDNPR